MGDAALAGWDLALAEECFGQARDLGSLLLLHTATANLAGLQALAAQAETAGLHNVAFSARWQLADVDGCIDLLLRTGRTAEARALRPDVPPAPRGRRRAHLAPGA